MQENLNCLLPDTKEVLKSLIKDEYLSNFILVGGSALALHLCHRKSEDLDFFSFQDGFDIQKIRKIVQKFKSKEILNISDEQVDVLLNGVKVTFFDAKWDFLKPKIVQTFNLASLEQLAIMKTNTLFLRAKYRDYYDLYFLSQIMDLKKIYDLSKDVIGVNFKLFSCALVYIEDIDDEDISYLQPEKDITLLQIRDKFEKELKLLGDNFG
jgi:predicted nucleotidyltransferase component of viral defense system